MPQRTAVAACETTCRINAESWKVLYAEQAIAQRELVVGITELERRKLTDARSMLKTLSRIALP